MNIRKGPAGRPSFYTNRVIISTNIEKAVKDEFAELAHQEHKSFAEKLQEIMMKELDEKKVVGLANPITDYLPQANKVSFGFDHWPRIDDPELDSRILGELRSIPKNRITVEKMAIGREIWLAGRKEFRCLALEENFRILDNRRRKNEEAQAKTFR